MTKSIKLLLTMAVTVLWLIAGGVHEGARVASLCYFMAIMTGFCTLIQSATVAFKGISKSEDPSELVDDVMNRMKKGE